MIPIFISHSSKDNNITHEVHRWLTKHGYDQVFVDFDKDDGLVAGPEWWNQLSEQLKRAGVMLALLSEHWFQSGPCKEEHTIARHERKPIIALHLYNSELDDFFKRHHYIEFEPQQAESWQRLERALEEAGAKPTLFRPDPNRPPFPGLLAFNVEDAALYFGREAEIMDVLARLDRLRLSPKRLFVIAGPSGAGKSSLLRAGILARLRRRLKEWTPILPFRPGLGYDQGIVLPLESTCRDWYQSPVSRHTIRERLTLEAGTPARFAEFFRQLTKEPQAIPLISIDQGEELLSTDLREDAEPMSGALAQLLSSKSPILGVITIRSDMLGALQQHPLLGPLIVDDVYALPPMPRERYALLIDGPISQYARYVKHGAEVEPALRDKLIDTAGGADALPLVAFTLGTLWEEYGGSDGQLTLDHLDQLGGVGGAVTTIAEKVIADAMRSPQGCDIAALRRAFVPGLAGVTVTGETVRRGASEHLLPLAARTLLDQFVKVRLLVRSEGPEGQAQLEIAHEALLRQWPRLVEWIKQDIDALRALERLDRAAVAWQQAEQNQDLLTHRGDVLARAVQVVATDLFENRFSRPERHTINLYLEACKTLERENKRRRLSSAIMLAAAFFEKAQREADQLRLIHAAALLGVALEANPYIRAAADVLEACSPEEIARCRLLNWRARSELYTILPQILFGFEAAFEVRAVLTPRLVFHPDGNTLVVMEGEKAFDIDLLTGEVRAWPITWNGTILDLSPGDNTALIVQKTEVILANRKTGGVLRRVELKDQQQDISTMSEGRLMSGGSAAVIRETQGCFFVDFDRDEVLDLVPHMTQKDYLFLYSLVAMGSDAIAIAGSDDVYTIDPRNNAYERYPSGQMYAIEAIAYDGVGRQLVFGGVNQELSLLDLQSKKIKALGTHQDAVSSITVLEEERLLISTALDGRAVVWSLSEEKRKFDLPTGGGMMRGSATSADNSRVAIEEDRGKITVWKKLEHRTVAALLHGNTITGAAYNPVVPGQIVSVSFVGETCAAVWTQNGEQWSKLDLGIRSPLRGVSMSPKGDVFAICGDKGEIQVYSVAGKHLRSFQSEGDFERDDGDERLRASRQRRQNVKSNRGPGFVPNVSVSHDSRRAAWVAPTGRIWIGDIQSGDVRAVSPVPGKSFSTVCFSPVEDAFVAVTQAGAALWIDALDGRTPLIDDASGNSTLGRGTPLAFSHDGKRLALATSESSITVLSTENPNSRVRLDGHTETFKRGWQEAVGALAFDPQGAFLVSAGSRQSGGDDPRTIRLWNLTTGDQLLRIITHADCLAASVDPFSDTICAGVKGRLFLLPFDRWLLSTDTQSIKQRMEHNLGASAESLL